MIVTVDYVKTVVRNISKRNEYFIDMVKNLNKVKKVLFDSSIQTLMLRTKEYEILLTKENKITLFYLQNENKIDKKFIFYVNNYGVHWVHEGHRSHGKLMIITYRKHSIRIKHILIKKILLLNFLN